MQLVTYIKITITGMLSEKSYQHGSMNRILKNKNTIYNDSHLNLNKVSLSPKCTLKDRSHPPVGLIRYTNLKKNELRAQESSFDILHILFFIFVSLFYFCFSFFFIVSFPIFVEVSFIKNPTYTI